MLRKTKSRRPGRTNFFESLETRRMLAVFNAGEGNDIVTVYSASQSIGINLNLNDPEWFYNPGTLTINLLGGHDTLSILGTGAFPVDIIVNMGSGDDVAHFSLTAGRLTNIMGACTLNGGGGNDSVIAHDFNSGTGTTYTVTGARFDRPGWGGFFYSGDIEALKLQQSDFDDTVNVTGTFTNQPVTLENGGGTDTINVGQSSVGVQSVRGDLHIEGTTGWNAVNINDTGNSSARSANFDWYPASPAFGSVNNLAPAKIIWETANTTAVNVTTGSAADSLLVYASTVPFTLNSSGGADAVQIGDTAVGGAISIAAPITIENDPDYTNLTINNYQDAISRTWTIDSSAGYGFIAGMTPAPIYWDNADSNAIFLNCGRGLDTGHIIRLSETMIINNAEGANIDQITFGHPNAGGMQSITPGRNGAIVIENNPDYTDLIFDDTNDSTARSITLDVVSGHNELTGLAPAMIRFDDNDVKQVTIRTGYGSDVVNVLRAGTNAGKITITSSAGGDVVTLGNSNTGMQEIVTDIDITNPPSLTTLTLFNRPDTVARNVTQTGASGFMQITGLIPGTLRYVANDISSVELDGGGANDTYTIMATVGGRPFKLETGAGSDTLIVVGSGFNSTVDLIETIILDASISIQDGGRVQLTGASPDQVLSIGALTLAGNGTLDIRDKQAILNYSGGSPISSIVTAVTTARNGGAWNQPGITSSVAGTLPGTGVGFGEASSISPLPSVFSGYGVDGTAILFRHTLLGDANINRAVNSDDFNILAGSFGQSGRHFSQANFNYDPAGLVSSDDFNILATNFGISAASGVFSAARIGNARHASMIDRLDGNALAQPPLDLLA